MNQIVDGVLKGVCEKLGQIDVKFMDIAVKHSQYDALVGHQQQQGKGGNGSSIDRTFSSEMRGLIHDKDIKMPEFRQKPESPEQFRRWRKDVAEYCEDKDGFRFPSCSTRFVGTRT